MLIPEGNLAEKIPRLKPVTRIVDDAFAATLPLHRAVELAFGVRVHDPRVRVLRVLRVLRYFYVPRNQT